jgi:hypothetical protein
VTYREGFVRNLRLTRAEGIGQTWVQGHTVQLENVGPNAVLGVYLGLADAKI